MLQGQPKETQAAILTELLTLTSPRKNERDRDTERKREMRSEATRIEIPECKNPRRRELCLGDPERLLRTYFADRYKRSFDRDRLYIIETMWELAKTRGRNAMAAPRGRGKTEIVKGMLVAIILAQLVRFPFVGGQTTGHGLKIYTDVRKKFRENDLLYEDFPEICHPVRELAGSPQRAGKQHVDGQLTRIVWTANDHLNFPHVPASPYGGVKLAYFGLDAAFRGKNIDGDRPDFIVIDDPETEESARSLEQIGKREKIVNQDIAGLVEEGDEIAIAIFSTIQNRYCVSFKLTDRKQYPQFAGVRFGLIEKWPSTVKGDDLGMWGDYISMRKSDQEAGDKHGRSAVKFYLANWQEMNDGAAMLSDEFTPKVLDDGTELIHSTLQVAFNRIADTNMAAFRTEYQNDPEPEEEIQTLSLTSSRVMSRLTKMRQGEAPSDTQLRTIGLDLGKYASHWTDLAWGEVGCVGSIVDYGIMETHGLTRESDDRSIEHALLGSLEVWADEIAGAINPQLVLIDAGKWPQAVYEFCRQRGRPFFPAKGWDQGRFRMPKRNETQVPFLEAYARLQPEERVWLYNVQTEYWKKWLQERFLTRPFNEQGARVDGSMTLFHHAGDAKRHLSFAHHITAEEEQLVPVDGKEFKRVWYVKNRNNHWLDSTALGCAAAGALGIRLVKPTTATKKQKATKKPETKRNAFSRDGRPYLVTQR